MRLHAISYEEELILQEKLEQDLTTKSLTEYDPTALQKVMRDFEEQDSEEPEYAHLKVERKNNLLQILHKDLDVSVLSLVAEGEKSKIQQQQQQQRKKEEVDSFVHLSVQYELQQLKVDLEKEREKSEEEDEEVRMLKETVRLLTSSDEDLALAGGGDDSPPPPWKVAKSRRSEQRNESIEKTIDMLIKTSSKDGLVTKKEENEKEKEKEEEIKKEKEEKEKEKGEGVPSPRKE